MTPDRILLVRAGGAVAVRPEPLKIFWSGESVRSEYTSAQLAWISGDYKLRGYAHNQHTESRTKFVAPRLHYQPTNEVFSQVKCFGGIQYARHKLALLLGVTSFVFSGVALAFGAHGGEELSSSTASGSSIAVAEATTQSTLPESLKNAIRLRNQIPGLSDRALIEEALSTRQKAGDSEYEDLTYDKLSESQKDKLLNDRSLVEVNLATIVAQHLKKQLDDIATAKARGDEENVRALQHALDEFTEKARKSVEALKDLASENPSATVKGHLAVAQAIVQNREALDLKQELDQIRGKLKSRDNEANRKALTDWLERARELTKDGDSLISGVEFPQATIRKAQSLLKGLGGSPTPPSGGSTTTIGSATSAGTSKVASDPPPADNDRISFSRVPEATRTSVVTHTNPVAPSDNKPVVSSPPPSSNNDTPPAEKPSEPVVASTPPQTTPAETATTTTPADKPSTTASSTPATTTRPTTPPSSSPSTTTPAQQPAATVATTPTGTNPNPSGFASSPVASEKPSNSETPASTKPAATQAKGADPAAGTGVADGTKSGAATDCPSCEQRRAAPAQFSHTNGGSMGAGNSPSSGGTGYSTNLTSAGSGVTGNSSQLGFDPFGPATGSFPGGVGKNASSSAAGSSSSESSPATPGRTAKNSPSGDNTVRVRELSDADGSAGEGGRPSAATPNQRLAGSNSSGTALPVIRARAVSSNGYATSGGTGYENYSAAPANNPASFADKSSVASTTSAGYAAAVREDQRSPGSFATPNSPTPGGTYDDENDAYPASGNLLKAARTAKSTASSYISMPSAKNGANTTEHSAGGGAESGSDSLALATNPALGAQIAGSQNPIGKKLPPLLAKKPSSPARTLQIDLGLKELALLTGASADNDRGVKAPASSLGKFVIQVKR